MRPSIWFKLNIADAIEGRYDEKLVKVVAKEADLVKESSSPPLSTDAVTLESYLLNGSTSSFSDTETPG